MKKSKTIKKAAALIIAAVFTLGVFAIFPAHYAAADVQTYWTDGLSADADYAFSGGDGTSAPTAYEIATTADLAQLAVNVNGIAGYSDGKYFKLTANIDLAAYWWTPIGTSDASFFQGSFDGNGNIISNLTLGSDTVSPSFTYAGLFGRISSAEISNLTLTGVSINVSSCICVGALAGYSYTSAGDVSSISDCSASGALTGSREGACHIGGLIGYLRDGYAEHCSSAVNVTGSDSDFAGGFTGRIYEGTVFESTASGNVTGGYGSGGFVAEINSDSLFDSCSSSGQIICGVYAGGFAAYSFGTMRNCSSSSTLSASDDSCEYVGGLVGKLYIGSKVFNSYCTGAVTALNTASNAGGIAGASSGTISNCYSTGTVTNGYGLAGSTSGATINHSFWNSSATTAGYPSGASFSGSAAGLASADMKTADFLSGLNSTALPNYTADWDGWKFMTGENGGYPILLWQSIPVITAGTAARTAQDTATVTFSANEAGAYYYEVLTDGATPVSPATTGDGTACTAGENTISLTGLSTGAKDIYIVLKDADNKVSSALKMDVPKLNWSDGHDIDDTYAYSGGSGTESAPYLIATADDLAQLAVNINSIEDYSNGLHFRLTGNIALSGSRWTPVGTAARPFTGTFDGNGYTVSGLSVESAVYQYAGLFGYADGAAFKNLTLDGTVSNTYSVTNCYAGGVVAYGVNLEIENCHNEAEISASAESAADIGCYAGGLAGYLTADFGSGGVDRTISGCTNEGGIAASATEPDPSNEHDASAYAGGIVGCYYSTDGSSPLSLSIAQCANSGSINATTSAQNNYSVGKSFAGGMVGDVIIEGDTDGTLVITGCSNTADIYTGSNGDYASGTAGGLAGELIVNRDDGDAVIAIEGCQNSGEIETVISGPLHGYAYASSIAGGIVGNAYSSADFDSTLTVSDCRNSGALSTHSTGYNNARSLVGGIVGSADAYAYSDNSSLVIKGCANTAQIAGDAEQVNTGVSMNNTRSYSGGIAGYVSDTATILSCYNRGAIDASGNSIYYAGGICGCPNSYSTLNISSCYSTGAVTSEANSDECTGGVAGYFTTGALTDCFWLDGSSVAAVGSGSSGSADASCTSKTSAELQSSSFVTTLNAAADAAAADYGVSDMPVWQQAANLSTNDGYPVLAWPAAPVVLPGGNTPNNITITNPDGSASVSGTLNETENGRVVTVGGGGFATVAGAGAGVAINTGSESITFNKRAANYIAGAAGTGNIILAINELGPDSLSSLLSNEDLALIGERPVYDFTLTANGTEISDFGGGSAHISIPYTLGAGENPFFVVVYYIDASGELQSVRGFYNQSTGMVTFRTKHFSAFAVGYNAVSFSDVAAEAWYRGAVGFIAARGITEGVDDSNYAPDMSLTRAQFLVMLMRAYGLEPDDSAADNFTDAGDSWYTGYLAKAKADGLTNGVGGNLFAPDCEITRQEMFTMLYNALKLLGELPTDAVAARLSDFEDSGDIASWAQAAMQALVESGIVSGSGGKLSPAETASRAEMAQLLYNILTK